jgi:hypothetical protein
MLNLFHAPVPTGKTGQRGDDGNEEGRMQNEETSNIQHPTPNLNPEP